MFYYLHHSDSFCNVHYIMLFYVNKMSKASALKVATTRKKFQK